MKRTAIGIAAAFLFMIPVWAVAQWSVSETYVPSNPAPTQKVEKRITVQLDDGSGSRLCQDISDTFQGEATFPSSFAYTVSFSGWRQNLLSACLSAHPDGVLEDGPAADDGDSFSFTIATLTPPQGGAGETSFSLPVGVYAPGKAKQELNASFTVTAVADTEAPVLSSASGTATGTTTADLSVSTANDPDGVLYYAVTQNLSAPADMSLEANQPVTAEGTQTVSVTGLTASTGYYAHFQHVDSDGNTSNVATSTQFTTATPDTEDPVLSSATGTATGTSTASLSVSTANDPDGVLYYAATTSATPPVDMTLEANQPVNAEGTQNVSVSGLATGTEHWAHFQHIDSDGNASLVATSASFTTNVSSGGTDMLLLSSASTCVEDGATQSSISVFCEVQDDANGDSVTTLEYREAGTSTWKDYHAPKRLKLDDEWTWGPDNTANTADDAYYFRDNIDNAVYNFDFMKTSCGSIQDINFDTETCIYGPFSAMLNNLDAGTTYEVRVTFSDPDGVTESGATAQQVLSIATKPIPNIWPASPNVTTVSTVSELETALSTPLAAGDVIALKPGTYNFVTPFRPEVACVGTAANPVVITSSTFWAWDVEITGAEWWFNECQHFVIRDLYFNVSERAVQFGRKYFDGSGGVPHKNVTVVRNVFKTASDVTHTLEFGVSEGVTDYQGGSEDVYIADNLFEGPNSFPATSSAGGSAAIRMAGNNFQVEYNTIRGYVDGTKNGFSFDHKTGSFVLRHNRVDYGKDDAFELDDVQSHMAVHDNLFTGTRGGLSWQAAWGDTYAFRNIGYGLGANSSPIKLKPGSGQDSGGYILIANNTFQKDGPALLENLSGTPTGTHIYSNVFLGEDHTGNHGDSTISRQVIKNWNSGSGFDADGGWDHNAWGYDGQFQLAMFKVKSFNGVGVAELNFSSYQAAMVSQHGMAGNDVLLATASDALNPTYDLDMTDDTYLPVFANPWPFNNANPTLDAALNGFTSYRHAIRADVLDRTAFEPHADSPLVDGGKVLAGYTDGYVGTAPDIGAVERGNVVAGDYGERVGLDSTALKQLVAGFGQGYTTGTIAVNESRRYGGATPVVIHDSPEHAYNYKQGGTATFASGAATDDNNNGLIDTPSDSIRQLIYENLSASNKSAWDAGTIENGGAYIGSGSRLSNLYEVWCGWAKHDTKGVYMTCTGHGDGGDNSIYEFNFGSGKWARISNPGAKPTPGTVTCDPADSGLTWLGVNGSTVTHPASHTYDGLEWIDSRGEMMLAGGGSTCGNSKGWDGYSYRWNPVEGHLEDYTANVTFMGSSRTSGTWASDHNLYLIAPGSGGVETFDPETGARVRGGTTNSGNTEPQVIWIEAAELPTQGIGMAVFADATGLYAITIDPATDTPSVWNRCVQNVPQDPKYNLSGGGTATDDVPFDDTGLTYDPIAKELVFWNGEAAYYTLPVSVIDGCGASDYATWHNTNPASTNFTKHALTGTHIPLTTNYLSNDAGKANITYSKFDWFGSVTLADGTVIDNLMVGGNAQAEGIWVMRK